jgi:hypothetical protein
MDPRGFPTTLPKFQRVFPDDRACAAYLESLRWAERFRLATQTPGQSATNSALTRYETAWQILHKLRAGMARRSPSTTGMSMARILQNRPRTTGR